MDVSQAEVDCYIAEGPETRRLLTRFLPWARVNAAEQDCAGDALGPQFIVVVALLRLDHQRVSPITAAPAALRGNSRQSDTPGYHLKYQIPQCVSSSLSPTALDTTRAHRIFELVSGIGFLGARVTQCFRNRK